MFSKVRALRLGALAIIGIGATFAVGIADGGRASTADYRKVEQELQDQRGLNQQLLQLLDSWANGSQTASGPISVPEYCQATPDAVAVETSGTMTGATLGAAASVGCSENVSGGVWRIVFRFDVNDASTGRRITAADGIRIKVIAPNGAEALASASGGADASSLLWAAAWDVPFDFSLGAGEYRIVVTAKGGQVYAWKPPAAIGDESARWKAVQVL